MPRTAAWPLALLAAMALAAPASAAPLAGQWHLDEPQSSTTHADSSGNNLTGAEVGSPTTIGGGRFGNALRFPSENDYVNVGNRPLLQPAHVSLLAWVRSSSVPPTVKAVATQGENGSCSFSSYALYTGGSAGASGLRFYIYNGSTFGTSPVASNAIWNGAWHLVAGTFDGASVRIYVDGAQVGTGTPTTGSIAYGLALDNNFIIGGGTDTACTEDTSFSGDVDEVRVYNRALTAGEIACLASGSATAPPVLVGGESPPSCGASAPPPPPPPPKPVLGRTVVARPLKGKVFVKVPGSHKFVRLNSLSGVPVKSLIDTRHGTVRLRSARNSKGKTQYGDFSRGIFQVRQSRRRRAKGLTELVLKGGNFRKVCRSGGRIGSSVGSARRRRSHRRWRRLSHKARGRFRTRGRYSSATVRGTTWTVSDRCDGTLTAVQRGKVVVRDFRKHKNVLVRRGKLYLAKAP